MKENQRVALTRRLLQEGLLRLLRETPLDKITVTALCREAGINRATFYNHYTRPADVLGELGGMLLEEIRTRAHTPKTMQEAQRCLEEICTCLYEHADLVRVLIRCNLDERFLQALNTFHADLWGLDSAIGRDLDSDSRLLLSTYLGSGGYFLVRRWLTEEIPKTPQEIAALIFGVFSRQNRR